MAFVDTFKRNLGANCSKFELLYSPVRKNPRRDAWLRPT